jgi:hypothetical protein
VARLVVGTIQRYVRLLRRRKQAGARETLACRQPKVGPALVSDTDSIGGRHQLQTKCWNSTDWACGPLTATICQRVIVFVVVVQHITRCDKKKNSNCFRWTDCGCPRDNIASPDDPDWPDHHRPSPAMTLLPSDHHFRTPVDRFDASAAKRAPKHIRTHNDL